MTTLHSTLFILVPKNPGCCSLGVVISTFHSVYISTHRPRHASHSDRALHSTLIILVQGFGNHSSVRDIALHSTLFILVLRPPFSAIQKPYSTFHSVYISTIAAALGAPVARISTFHSVYISTIFPVLTTPLNTSLHSTLFILVRSEGGCLFARENLYIPLCLY